MLLRSFLTFCAVLAIGLAAAPAHAGGGGGGKGGVNVRVKNIGSDSFYGAAKAGSSSTFPSRESAYKNLSADGGTASFKVKKGTFTLFGGDIIAEEPVPLFSQELQTARGSTTYVHADALEGLATVVTRGEF